MESTTEQSYNKLEKLTKASLTPKRLSPRNTHLSPTKYCLNKPKLFRQFRKSSLFQNSTSIVNLHPYSQRYTYNQKINSFEKQAHNSTVKPFDVERFISSSPQKLEKVQKMSKQNMLKKKMPQIASQNSQFSSSLGSSVNFKRTFSRKVSLNHYLKDQKLQQFASRALSVQNKEQKRLKTSKRKFIDGFPVKGDKNVLMQYINRNPININLKKFYKGHEESKQQQNLLKTNKSFRKLVDSGTRVQRLTLGGQKLKQLQEQDQKYERQKVRLRQELFYLIDEEIKKLYDLISQLKGLGYSDEKVSEWIWIFCENNKKFLQQIIFKPQNCRNSIIETKVVHKMEDIEQTKANAKKYKRVINNIPIDIQMEDLTEITSYLEEIFISKQYFELKRLQNKIQDTRQAIKNNYIDMKNEKVGEILKYVNSFQEQKKFKPLEYYEMLSFYEDAKRIESHFGNVKGLSSGNKKKFENLTDVEFQIQRKKKEIQN